jgi:hypothetical protein
VSGDRVVIHFRALRSGSLVGAGGVASGPDGAAAAPADADGDRESTAHWGFRVFAETPVREDVVQQILDNVEALTEGQEGQAGQEGHEDWEAPRRPSAAFVRRVVAMFHNDLASAGAYVQEAMLFSSGAEEQVQDIWMSDAVSGLYASGNYEVNLQTAEVYTKVRLGLRDGQWNGGGASL